MVNERIMRSTNNRIAKNRVGFEICMAAYLLPALLGRFRGVLPVALCLLVAACGGGGSGGGFSGSTRTYLMGFSPIPPKPDQTLQLPTLDATLAHSDAGLIQLSIPWTVLLSGISAVTEVTQVRLPLVNYYRANGKKIVVALDVTDGLNRAQEDPALVGAGRSITEPAIQQLYLDYVLAVNSILRPDYMSLAAETNLIRLVAQPALYSAVVAMVNSAANQLRNVSGSTRLMVSVQVEAAWGALQGGTYTGVAQDRADFPFIDVLGLSSYPYFAGYTDPAAIPDNYYQRLVEIAPLPVIVLEGGWPSVTVGNVASTPALQSAYILRQAELLDATDARAVFQITFTDLDPAFWPAGIVPFANLGLVDVNLNPKAALAAWDSVLGRPLQ